MPSKREKNRTRRRLLHGYRVGVFVLLIALIHQQHTWFVEQKRGALKQKVEVEQIAGLYPKAASLSDWDPSHGGQNVLDAEGKKLGHVIQTSPEADKIVGFSGPTNTLIAFGAGGKILGVRILRSEDTKEHVGDVLKSDAFLGTWTGLDREEAADLRDIDGVSGATLTSMAIADGITVRLGGSGTTSRFPEQITVEEVKKFLPEATSFAEVENRPYLLKVLDADGGHLGFASRTSPHADHMLGYQGPTDLLIVLDNEERVAALAVRGTFDNQPYVSYLDEDEYFFNLFKGFGLADLSKLDVVEAEIEGVSGATKTSVTVAEALILSAGELLKVRKPPPPKPLIDLAGRDIGTTLVVIAGLLIAFTKLRGKKSLRFAFQAVLIIYLGFINADMVSQALLVGWAQNGVAWKVAPALVLLTAAALIAPIFTGRQAYCTHLCPYGAAQDWLKGRLPVRVKIPPKLEAALKLIPALLLAFVVVVAMGHLGFSLVGIEPFDAFVFRIAGWMTITVAVVGLIASLFITRAYCRYGCPTGAMLDFIRLGPASDKIGKRDLFAAALVLTAVGMTLWR